MTTKQRQLVPRSFWNFPSFQFPFSWDDEDESWSQDLANPSGLSIYETEQNVVVEAAIPGLEPKDVEITFDQGVLWIKGEKKKEEEEKNKKYYRRATSSFSYRLAVPGQIDESKEPEASYQNGILFISFIKAKQMQPKKISIKNR